MKLKGTCKQALRFSRQMAENQFLLDWVQRGEPAAELNQWLNYAKQIKTVEKADAVFWLAAQVNAITT